MNNSTKQNLTKEKRRAARRKKNAVTIAEKVTVIALALFMAAEFYGNIIINDDPGSEESITMGSIVAIAVTALFAVLTILLLKIKRKEVDVTMWRVVEGVAVVVYIVLAAVLAKPVLFFFACLFGIGYPFANVTLIIYIILHLMILFNYYMSYRPQRVVSNDAADDGITL